MPSKAKATARKSKRPAGKKAPAAHAGRSRRRAQPAAEAATPRSFWSGTLSFGLVTIPVELFSATRSNRRSLRMLAPDGTPLSRRYFSADGKPLDNSDLERGYALDADHYVVVDDEELERLLPDQSRDINLTRFVPEGSIPPLFFDRAYILAPARGVNSAYRLLAATMQEQGKQGIASFVMRERQYVVAIRAEDGVLRAETLRFADELRKPEELGIGGAREPSAAQLRTFRGAIKKLSKPRLPAADLKDDYWERLTHLVERKQKQHEDVVPLPSAAESEAEGAQIIDLMELLQASLSKSKPANNQRRHRS